MSPRLSLMLKLNECLMIQSKTVLYYPLIHGLLIENLLPKVWNIKLISVVLTNLSVQKTKQLPIKQRLE